MKHITVAVLSLIMLGAIASAQVVSHVKVLSDKVEDVSSLQAWKSSFIKPGMSDRDKALAIWNTVVKFRHQDAPANEFIENEGNVHDPIKVFNVYGYGMCCCASAHIEALARYAGLQTRGWGITAHSVPEIFYDGDWHVLDASLITYFPGANGRLLGVKEIAAGIDSWLNEHPDLRGNDAKLRQFMQNKGWKKGPAVLANCPFYDENGWLPAATHGWYSTMQEYGKPSKNFQYEYGTAVGYELNVQLRRGMRLIRYWANKGLHVNKLEGGDVGALKGMPGQNDMRYAVKYGDLAPGRIGNGELFWTVNLDDFTDALSAENLLPANRREIKPMQVKNPAELGVLILRVPSSYVYLGGTLWCGANIEQGGQIDIAISDNNGLDFKPIDTLKQPGVKIEKIDLKPFIHRRYDYRLKFTLKGAGTGIMTLELAHDVQHSQRALPALDQGKNTITFSAGPQTGTITVQGAVNPEHKGKNVAFADFRPQIKGMKGGPLFLEGSTGEIVVPIATPGDIVSLRVGGHYRVRDQRDSWDLQVSFDDGKTYRSVQKWEGPFAGNSGYVVVNEVPNGAKAALVRLVGQQVNTTGIFDLRIDADYAEPAGRFLPVKVTYTWLENGVTKRDEHVAKQPNETYFIQCARKPIMSSIALELAGGE